MVKAPFKGAFFRRKNLNRKNQQKFLLIFLFRIADIIQ